MKISISRLIETAKFLNTKAGQELSDLILYLADFVEQVLRALNGGLTFDNWNGKTKRVSLKHDTATVVASDGKAPVEVRILRIVSTSELVTGWGWWLNNSGQLVVKAKFDSAPTDALDVDIAISYG